jgi:uncharacterized membrane protein YeaQ/YmgE (transglycosylase-associated protein family)
VTTVVVITAIVGVLAALAVRAVMPGRQILGLFGSALAGTVGAVGAGYGGQAAGWFKLGDPLAFVAAAVGGVVVVAILSRLFR